MKFDYTAFDSRGRKRTGKVNAANIEEASKQLTERSLSVLKIGKSKDIDIPLLSNRKPSLKDRAIFTQQFAQLLGSGTLSQVEALEVAARNTQNQHLRETIEKIRNDILKGEELYAVFAKKEYEKSFDPVFIAFIRMGVTQGNIVRPLKELAEMYKWTLKMAGTLKKALTLPGIIALACVTVTWFIMAKVVPTFMKILTDMNAEMPTLTRMVKRVSEVVGNPIFTLAVLASVFLAVYAVGQYRRTMQGKYQLDLLVLRVPILGPLLRSFILARISSSLSVMLRNDISLVDALKISSQVANNEVYRKYLLEMRDLTISGRQIFPVLFENPKDFPENYSLQFRAAESHGTLKDTLRYLSDVYNDEVTANVESLTSTIEPILMVFLGSLVLMIVTSVFLPMAAMMQSLSK